MQEIWTLNLSKEIPQSSKGMTTFLNSQRATSDSFEPLFPQAILIDFPEKSACAPHEVSPLSHKLCPRGFFLFPFLLVFQYIICFCCKMKNRAVINIIGLFLLLEYRIVQIS